MKILLSVVTFLLFSQLLGKNASVSADYRGSGTLGIGQSLAVGFEADFLVSPSGTFTCGFYEVGTNAYCFSIWFTNSANRTVTWMANRDKPVNGNFSELSFQKDGNLVLVDADGSVIWETNTFLQNIVRAELLETGNLVLINQTDDIVWESFSFPTDTLLPHQTLTKANMLVSMKGPNAYSSGYYKFHFTDNNILSLMYDGPQVSSVYWPNPDISAFQFGRTPYDSNRTASLDELGNFESSDNLIFNASDYGVGPKRRLTVGYDGMLRLYTLEESSGLWEVTWFPDIHPCNVHGLCGSNGICLYDPSPSCVCPPGFNMTDPSDWSKGCSPNFTLTCNQTDTDFVQLFHTDYYGYDLVTYGANKSFEACRNACITDCKCQGFGYQLFSGSGNCYPKSILLNGYQMPQYPNVMYIKVPAQTTVYGNNIELHPSSMNCSDASLVIMTEIRESTHKNQFVNYLIGFVAGVGILEIICIGTGWWFINKIHRRETVDMGYFALALGFQRFTYEELKSATQNFEEEIGRGGFGTVYKGSLDAERVVAVKRLEGNWQGETEFWAEVSIIGRINHSNLVKMWGFCAEGKHRLLVYEYLENGSLDKILFSTSSKHLEWTKRFHIALGTAKGLSYLHEECLEWVLHCDIKPQNILLDENLQPKVADFGMSKLVEKKGPSSNFSRVRGTRGYLAPEWMMNQEITSKADVYSYGIVLLELISGKSASDYQESEFNHLAQWVKEMMKQTDGIKEVVDPRLNGDYDEEQLYKMIWVALLCVRDDKKMRPSMSQVVGLLLGDDIKLYWDKEILVV